MLSLPFPMPPLREKDLNSKPWSLWFQHITSIMPIGGDLVSTTDTQTLTNKTLVSPIISNLTASRIVYGDASKVLQSIADLTAWIGGTVNQITVADDGDGSITLSLPQDIHVGATPTFAGLTLSGLTLGSIPFAGVGGLISQDNANFFWDNTNKRLGIGISPPSYPLDIRNDYAISSLESTTGINSTWLRFRNTGGNVVVGQESSVGGAIFVGTDPYSAVIGHGGAYHLHLVTGGVVRLTILDDGNVGIAKAPGYPLDIDGDLNLDTGHVFRVNAIQVVGARVIDARLANIPNSGDGNTDDLIDALRDLVISHGLGASA